MVLALISLGRLESFRRIDQDPAAVHASRVDLAPRLGASLAIAYARPERCPSGLDSR